MPKKSRVFLSNSTVFLLAKLAENLFSKQQTPTAQRWILVPNSNISYWVKKELTKATSNHVFMGSRIFSSSDALIKHILKEVCFLNPEMPDYITLPLFIHEILKSSLSCSDSQRKFSHSPAYATSKQLASIFKNFYVFSQLPDKNKHPFQEKIFSQLNTLFHPLEAIFQSILTTIATKNIVVSLHIFGCSHLPYHIASFFENLGKFFNIYFYAFTPSKEFFSDIRSDKTIHSFQKTSPEAYADIYNQYTAPERHTLLANLSYKMQMFQNFCIDNNLDCVDVFKQPQHSPQTSLQYIQDALYRLHPIHPQEVANHTQTICVSKAYHASREVQDIFTKISHLLKEGVHPEEIFILSSNLQSYSHYLHAIFSPHIPIYFLNHETSQTLILKEKIRLLFSLLQTEGNIHRLLQILSHPDLIKPINKLLLPSLTRALLDEWQKISNINDNPIGQLILNIMSLYPFIETDDHINLFELWENVLPLLDELKDFVAQTSPSKELSYCEHFKCFYEILSKIFQLSPQEEEYLILFQRVIYQKVQALTCSLSFFTDFLLDFLSTFRNASPLYQPGPYVGTLSDSSFLPKGYTFIIGASETTNFDPDTLDLQSIKEKDTTSSPEDEENFHFLQTLISTQHELHISYVSSKNTPSKLKYFLQNLLDITGLQVISLGLPIYHPSLFKKKATLHSSQAHYYHIAKTCHETKTSLLPCFISAISSPPSISSFSIQTIVNTILYPFEQFLLTQYGKIYAPKYFKSQTQIFPNEKFVKTLWDAHIFNEKKVEKYNNYTSPFSKNICLNYDKALKEFFLQYDIANNFHPSVVCLSDRIFHKIEQNKQRILSPLQLEIENQKITIHGRIGAIYKEGLFINQIAPSQTFAKGKKHSSSQLKNLLEGYISLAVLQTANISNQNALHAVAVQSQNNQQVVLVANPIPVPFSDPEEYLYNVIKIYNHFLTTPVLITYSNWQETNNASQKFDDQQQKKQCDSSDNDCFFFYHRDLSEFSPLDQNILNLIQTIFPKPTKQR